MATIINYIHLQAKQFPFLKGLSILQKPVSDLNTKKKKLISFKDIKLSEDLKLNQTIINAPITD